MFETIIALVTEDLVGVGVQLFFTWTIIMMIRDAQKPPLATSIPTGIALIIFGVGGSVSAPFVAALSVVNGLLWLYIGYQRYTQKGNIETRS